MPRGVEPKTNAPPAPASPQATPAVDLSGRILDDYRLLRRVGAGGMGQVYLAEQVSLKRRVALKILKAELAADPTMLERFQREAKAVARVTHANIVQVYQVGDAGGVYYMALEYVEGRNLRDYVARKGPPEALLALSIMRQVAAALQRAGELGIIHRDIKPENILLTRKGEVKVADFGLSLAVTSEQPALNLTQTGVTMGTPLYMSPEQVEGKPLDPRTDMYSFGVSCYYMLSGQPPFRGHTAFEVALQHVQSEPAPLATIRPDLPAELCAIVHKMMAKKPDDRYQTCRELLVDLAQVRQALNSAGTGGVLTRPLAITGPLPLVEPESAAHAARITGQVRGTPTGAPLAQPRRRWLPWALVGSVLLAATGGGALGWLRLHAGTKAAAGAQAATDVNDPRPLPSEAEREKFLQTAVQQYLKPSGATPQEMQPQVRMGLDHAVELAVFYLDRWKLTEADDLFARLTAAGDKVPQYRQLGQVGHAIALALQDRPAESNKLFLEVVAGPGGREKFLQAYWLRQNPKMQVWIARALDHNAANAPGQFPKELRPLQSPPQFIGPRRPAG
jgi:eukaryotic-like serine/threonine-protein kinase